MWLGVFFFLKGFLSAPRRFHGLGKLHVSFCALAVFNEGGAGPQPAPEAFCISLDGVHGRRVFHFLIRRLAPYLFPNHFHVFEQLGVQSRPGRRGFWFGERHRKNGFDGSAGGGSWKV